MCKILNPKLPVNAAYNYYLLACSKVISAATMPNLSSVTGGTGQIGIELLSSQHIKKLAILHENIRQIFVPLPCRFVLMAYFKFFKTIFISRTWTLGSWLPKLSFSFHALEALYILDLNICIQKYSMWFAVSFYYSYSICSLKRAILTHNKT